MIGKIYRLNFMDLHYSQGKVGCFSTHYTCLSLMQLASYLYADLVCWFHRFSSAFWFPHTNAHVKGHLEPAHLKSSSLFTYSTKALGRDSPSGHRCKNKVGGRFTKLFFLVKIHFQNRIIKQQNARSFKIHCASNFTR